MDDASSLSYMRRGIFHHCNPLIAAGNTHSNTPFQVILDTLNGFSRTSDETVRIFANANCSGEALLRVGMAKVVPSAGGAPIVQGAVMGAPVAYTTPRGNRGTSPSGQVPDG